MAHPSHQPFEGSTHMPGIMLRIAKIPTSRIMRSFKASFKESKNGGLWTLGFMFLQYLRRKIYTELGPEKEGVASSSYPSAVDRLGRAYGECKDF